MTLLEDSMDSYFSVIIPKLHGIRENQNISWIFLSQHVQHISDVIFKNYFCIRLDAYWLTLLYAQNCASI